MTWCPINAYLLQQTVWLSVFSKHPSVAGSDGDDTGGVYKETGRGGGRIKDYVHVLTDAQTSLLIDEGMLHPECQDVGHHKTKRKTKPSLA